MTKSLYRCPCCGKIFLGVDAKTMGYILIPAKCPKCSVPATPVFGTMLKDKKGI